MPSPDLIRLRLFSDGEEVSQEHHVLSVVVTRALNRIPYAQVVLQDGDVAAQDFPLSNEPLFAPGRELEIRAGYHEEEATLFKGLVLRHSIRARRGARNTLTVECRDKATKATVGRKSAIYSDMTDSDILSEVLGRHGVDAQVEDTSVTHVQMVQADVSDWDFVLERAEANGLVVRVEDGAVAVEKPDTSGEAVKQLTFGQELFEVEAETDARHQLEAAKGEAWDPKSQELLVAEAEEPSFTPPGNQSASELAGIIGHGPVELRHGGRLAEGELKAWASSRLLRSRMALVRGRAKCQGDASLKLGVMVELIGVGERFSGNAYVTGVRHQITPDNWETDLQFGLAPEPYREAHPVEAPLASGLVAPLHGLQVGVVTALQDDPDGEERIQVRLPIVSADSPGVWARLALLDAGENRGSIFRPEVGDEVVLGFVNQDPRDAVVLGMLHSSAKASPIPASDDNHQKGFVTRSEMKLLFDDEKKVMTLLTPGGNTLVLNDDEQGVLIEDQNGNKVQLSPDGIVIESAGTLTLKAAGDVSVEGVNVNVKASAQLKAEGSGGAEVSTSAVAVLKGSLVQIN
ncbi:MAG: type VI secretion system tip protein VgrG [Myxococcaceae bacterium]|nr:type VI secretion system tip protein VgrG [Myxococcaceae bacterium]